MNWGPQLIHEEKITFDEYKEHGCPICGEHDCYILVQSPKEAVARCAGCDIGYIVSMYGPQDERR